MLWRWQRNSVSVEAIGHHDGKALTSSDKQKIREQYTKWKFVHQYK